MTNKEALFFAELWLSDKCNKTDDVMYQFMLVVFEALKKQKDEEAK